MDKPSLPTRVVPASALFHVAPLTQEEFIAVQNAIQYFARRLRDVRQRGVAESAAAKFERPAGMELPSEGERAADASKD